jgi:hypothetical protein
MDSGLPAPIDPPEEEMYGTLLDGRFSGARRITEKDHITWIRQFVAMKDWLDSQMEDNYFWTQQAKMRKQLWEEEWERRTNMPN